MATKRLTDTGIANFSFSSNGRQEIWDAIVPGLGVRIGGRRKTFIAMVRTRGRLRRVTLGAHPSLGVADARAKARNLIVLLVQRSNFLTYRCCMGTKI